MKWPAEDWELERLKEKGSTGALLDLLLASIFITRRVLLESGVNPGDLSLSLSLLRRLFPRPPQTWGTRGLINPQILAGGSPDLTLETTGYEYGAAQRGSDLLTG